MRNKITKLLLTITMMIAVLPILQVPAFVVEAKTTFNYYPMACNAYEVDTINDSGSFVKTNCYGDFSSAKAAMKAAGNDAVVRHAGSYSANQIVAMTRGYVYSYALRDDSSILTIDQNTSQAYGKSTYISNYRSMLYEDTTYYDGSGSGTVLVNAYGFEGNVELKDVDFVPSKFVDKGIAIWIGGNDASDSPESEWQLTPERPYYSVEQSGNYTDLVYHLFSSQTVSDWSSQAYDISGGGMHVGPAASWMSKGSVYYSWNDTDYYSDPELKNYINTYYNYYQFVPLRTKSKISADAYNSFVNNYYIANNKTNPENSALWNSGQTFLDDQNQYGINAAMVFAQACCESAYGTSYFATSRNNLFGVNAYDSDPNNASSYASVKSSIDNQMGLLLRQYADTVHDQGVFFGGHFGNKGSGITVKYASSPYYGLTLASLYYRFDKMASGNNGTLTDWNSSCIGVIKNSDTNIYSSADGSNVMYTTAYGPTYQMNFTVSILGESGDYYKVQSTDYVQNGAVMNLSRGTYADYNWSSMVGYIRKSDITNVLGTVPTLENAVDGESVVYQTHVQDVGWQSYVANGELSGTTGKSLRLEGIKISADGNTNGSIQYRTHVENIGWQDWTSDGQLSGTTGQSLRLEGIQIRLTGDLASKFDIYYQVHAENYGWLDWAENGEAAGTEGLSYRLEGIRIVLVRKNGTAPGSTDTPFVSTYTNGLVRYRTHVQDVGWQSYVSDGTLSGTTGQSLRLEGINISLSPNVSGSIEYCTHVQDIGWQSYVSNGAMSGTQGQSLRLEAIQIRLTGDAANQYDIYYQVHSQDVGWMGWAKNGEKAGTAGYSRRLEGIRIVLVAKNGAAPGSTANCFIEK